MFYASMYFVYSNSKEYYKVESSILGKTSENTDDVFKMIVVSKRVFDILPTKKPKMHLHNLFQKIARETTRHQNKAEKHCKILMKMLKMFMRQMEVPN